MPPWKPRRSPELDKLLSPPKTGKQGQPPEDPLGAQPIALPIDEPLNVPAAVVVDNAPTFTGIHAEFLADATPQICMEGARYSGKTWVGCAKVVKSCIDNPGIEWLICRYANEETEKKLVPEFRKMCHRYGQFPEWIAKENAFLFPNHSRIEATGLRSADKLGHLAKVRGLDKGGILNDQSEELPQDIGEELPFGTRQSGYPHQTIYMPNPPQEDHWLSDFFPDDNSIEGRRYYRVSLYDNPHCPEDKLAELERLYPPTHARHKTLVLGLRGPAATGVPVYEDSFLETLHLAPVSFDPDTPLLEGFHMGQHHPVWLVAQRNYFGGIHVLGGIMGKRLFLEDFLPVVDRYRAEWFGAKAKRATCCDPPPEGRGLRFTNIQLLRDAGLRPRYVSNGNAPDVREAVIQSIVGYMHKRLGRTQAFLINNDPAHWLMASHAIVKKSKFFIDGCQSNYVWDEHMVSVANKLHRQPKPTEWVESAQRCLENIVLNFCARKSSQETIDAEQRKDAPWTSRSVYKPPSAWS